MNDAQSDWLPYRDGSVAHTVGSNLGVDTEYRWLAADGRTVETCRVKSGWLSTLPYGPHPESVRTEYRIIPESDGPGQEPIKETRRWVSIDSDGLLYLWCNEPDTPGLAGHKILGSFEIRYDRDELHSVSMIREQTEYDDKWGDDS